jgi:hypothetical protein
MPNWFTKEDSSEKIIRDTFKDFTSNSHFRKYGSWRVPVYFKPEFTLKNDPTEYSPIPYVEFRLYKDYPDPLGKLVVYIITGTYHDLTIQLSRSVEVEKNHPRYGKAQRR